MHFYPTRLPGAAKPPWALAISPWEEKKNSPWELQCITVCYTVNPFAHIDSLANVHCNESLVWFKVSGFCYTINTGFSLGLLSRHPAIALCHRDLTALDL